MPPPAYGPQPPMYGPQPMYAGPKPPSAIPVVGGILLIVAAILGFVGIALWFLVAGSLTSGIPFLGAALGAILLVCGAIVAIFSAFALIGGIMAIRRKMWGLALTGGILGLFTLGPYGVGSLLALVGLILVGISHDEFT
ncbi:MAG TPA: hypothetical protein VGR51_01130 [Thermoplasmata archaeon]|nr:hypothetical protein [Thermoplasmata archaeon]